MRHLLIITTLFFSTFCFSQNKTATTEDGKKVILKSDNTWEYSESSKISKSDCVLDANYEEPKSDKKVLKWLKKFDATTDDLKKHIAVENDCKVEDVKLLSISEQKGNGMYSLCVNGKKMKYRRMGSVFSRLDENLIDKN